MKDMIFQKRVENAVDTTLASLNPSVRQCDLLIENIKGGKKSIMGKKAICDAGACDRAYAADGDGPGRRDHLFARRVPATEIADQALLQTYGITARMQSLFTRETAEGEGGTTVVTYEGIEHLAYVLGKYTVIVDGKTVKTIFWSHDGEDMRGGLEASAWGKDQPG